MTRPVLALLASGLLALVAACASLEAETPAQRVFALKSEYRAVLALAVDYESLPRCPSETTPVCSEPEVVELLRRADRRAELALDGAEQVVRSPAASEGAVALALESAGAAVAVLRQVLIDEGVL
ncbi:MAG: hypothetical protein QNJ30_12150 [Kiloniellales bacterium]|nr:hypothetical protein [Kiloniellales bacterium]